MSKCPTKNMMKNIIDFNVVPIMHEEEIGNFDEFDKNIQVTMKGGHNHQWTWCSVLSYFRI